MSSLRDSRVGSSLDDTPLFGSKKPGKKPGKKPKNDEEGSINVKVSIRRR